VRVLIAHSFYRQSGGEDRYVREQVQLLQTSNVVRLEERTNAQLSGDAATAVGMLRSPAERARLKRSFREFRPDVVHLHNPYPSLGPEVHLAAHAADLPLVQTTHNFRIRCPNGVLFTEGAPCERCVGGRYDNALRHACFPTMPQRAAYSSALWVHRFVLHLDSLVDLYVAPSRYVRTRLIEWGIPVERTRVVRNFTHAPLEPPPLGSRGLFLGRLAPEKGADTLVRALVLAGDPPFDIVGDGPERRGLEADVARLGLRRVRFHGAVPPSSVPGLLATSGYLVVPSSWGEAFGLSAVEAMGAGRPVIASAGGGLPELVGVDRGILVPARSPEDLAAAITRYLDDPVRAAQDGAAGRAFVLEECSPAAHLAGLEAAYASAIAIREERREPGLPAPRPSPRVRERAPVDPSAARRLGGRSLHVLMVHCYYRDLGGENLSFEAEVGLLEAGGVRVTTYTRDNRELDSAGSLRRVQVGLRTTWADDAYGDLAHLIRTERPDVVHVQNTFPLISPAAVHAAHRLGKPVVQALRNYRLLCASGILYRDGGICRDCVGRTIPLPAIQHACYHGSIPRTSAVVSMQMAHRLLGTWRDAVSLFVAPSEFARQTFVSAGIPAEQIVVKPNFVHPDPGMAPTPGSYALFAGRLALEKGVLTMVEAWRDPRLPPLRIAGDGPIRGRLEAQIVAGNLQDRVDVLGNQPPERVLELMRNALVAVFPSEWYETFGRVAAEAFACGVPVVASRLGAMAEIVDDGVTGRLFTPGDPRSLADAVLDVTGSKRASIGSAARSEFEARYSAERNLDQLLAIYEQVLRQPRLAAGRT